MPLEGRNHLDSVGMLRLWRPRGSPSADEVAQVADEAADKVADKGRGPPDELDARAYEKKSA